MPSDPNVIPFSPNADADVSYDSIIGGQADSAGSQAALGMDSNPDDGVKALQLGRATGVPPQTVYGNVDAFSKKVHAQATQSLVSNNSWLTQYVNSAPLANVVSNGDYGNLDTFSQVSGMLHRYATNLHDYNPVNAIFDGAVNAATQAVKEPGLDIPDNYSFAAKSLFRPADLAVRGVKGGLAALMGSAEGLGNYVQQRYTEATGDDPQAHHWETLGQEFATAAQFIGAEGASGGEILRQTMEHQTRGALDAAVVEQHAKAQADFQVAIDKAKPYIDANIPVPRGVHPIWDSLNEQVNSHGVDMLGDAMDKALTTETLARDPESFKQFAEIINQDRNFTIDGNAVAREYGIDSPAPDDKLLGWVPDIENKLAAAREFGDPISVPYKDWLTHADKDLFKQFQDHIKIFDSGITREEAKSPVEVNTIDAALPQARGVFGLEPLFAVGDKKLELKQMPSFRGAEEFHEYAFQDQNGNPVGSLTILPDEVNKQLYVANINGLAGLHANSFGPSLIRDLKRQLREIYPGYETITGHRVSGARYSDAIHEINARKLAARDGYDYDKLDPYHQSSYIDDAKANIDNPTDHPVVKLAVPEATDFAGTHADYNDFHTLLDNAYKQKFGRIDATILPKELWSRNEIALEQAFREEMARTAPEGVEAIGTHGLEHGEHSGIQGVYNEEPGNFAHIMVDLMSPDPVGIGRHELIHHLFRKGFFTGEEWTALGKASLDEGWLDRYGIKDRYGFLDEAGQHEEAIAEAYRDWAKNKDVQPDTFVGRVFQKLYDLIQRLQARFREILGQDPTSSDLFDAIRHGDFKAREGNGGEGGPKFALDPDHPAVAEAKAALQIQLSNLRADVSGINAISHRMISKELEAQHMVDIQKSVEKAVKAQEASQRKEFKAKVAEIRPQVVKDLQQRPDVAADLFVSAGQIGGKKLEKNSYSLRAEDLTEEQKAQLPRRYYSKDGLPTDAVGSLFGFPSGDAMVESLAQHAANKGDMTSLKYFEHLVNEETAKRTADAVAELNKDNMSDAIDAALSDHQINIMSEELQGTAMEHGINAPSLGELKTEVQRLFDEKLIGDTKLIDNQKEQLRVYNIAANLLAQGKNAEAVPYLQRRLGLALAGRLIRDQEKMQKAWVKNVKAFSRRMNDSVPAEYMDPIHDIMSRVGVPIRRSAQSIADSYKAYGHESLQKFVENKQADFRIMPTDSILFDPNFNKEFASLTNAEFKAVHESLANIIWNGRDEGKIYKAGEAANFADIKSQMISNIVESSKGQIDPTRRPASEWIRNNYYLPHIQMETLAYRFDGFNSKGPWMQYFMRDLVESANQVQAWQKEFAEKLRQIESLGRMNQKVENTIFRDQDKGTLIPMTRRNLLGVLLNLGTESNHSKLAGGYGLDRDVVMQWADKHATREDWAYAQGVWKLFKDMKSRTDTMYRSMSGGVAPENIPGRMIQTKHGPIEGDYYPVVYDRDQVQNSKKLRGSDPTQPQFIGILPKAGFAIDRTFYKGPMELNVDAMPNRLAQQIHITAMLPALKNAAKIAGDKEILSAIRKHYGTGVKDMFDPYLRAVGNTANFDTKVQSAMGKVSEFLRQNTIATVVGLNPSTIMKHGFTAMYSSIHEIGAMNYLNATKGLMSINEKTGESNYQFAMNNSLELQRRSRNANETLYGTSNELVDQGKYTKLRANIMDLASKPIAFSDKLSSVPTWLGRYNEMIDKGESHGDAVYEADLAVRRSHGSTAITNRTQIQRDSNAWLVSVYNFWSDIMNRQLETVWKAGEVKGIAQRDGMAAGIKSMAPIIGGVFAYVIWPAIVENMVSPEPHKEDTPWGVKAGAALGRSLTSSWVGVRDIANALSFGQDPQYGFTGTAAQLTFNGFRDAMKNDPLGEEHRGKLLQDGAAMIGVLTGMMPLQVGKTGRFAHDVAVGKEDPENTWQWLVGSRYGTTKKHSHSVREYITGDE